MLFLIEAVNSVALSHDEDCDCMVCRAADGDQGAMQECASLFVASALAGRRT